MQSMMASSPPKAGIELFERILSAPGGLIALEGGDMTALLQDFRAIARHTGQAVYLWQPDVGLGSLREAHSKVPGCQRLGNALRYMQQSMHFGVYLMSGIELPLSAMDATLLRQLARAPSGHLRRVVLLDPPAALVEHFGEAIVRISAEAGLPARPRLRDGRWVL
ncbi:MAG: hypothetical protein B7X39_13435 [Lysobacterales bacterium 14-68-21]|jgi:hypothetical protein|nr:MAG: hypothetical protein B7X45_12325 [Xanthomonadales bacterium 15-68-25]OZB65272.1 MAG: hypothetical protein B7X39_13435 [Xanthomonadales bacterium 14-68-21]